MGLLTDHVEQDEPQPGVFRNTIHMKPIAYRDAGVLRANDTTWVDSGDGTYPHVVSKANMMIAASNTGILRWMPTRDTQVWMEIGDPVYRDGGIVKTFDFANPTRDGNRISWNKPAARLIYDHGGHFGKFGLVLKTAFRPDDREFAFPLTYQGLVRNGRTLSYNGQDVMTMRPFDCFDLADPEAERINVPHRFQTVQGVEYVILTLPIEIDAFAQPVLDPTLALQPDATDGLDTYIQNGLGTLYNAGVTGDVNIGHLNVNHIEYHTLIKFDLTSLPSNAAISSAILSLYCRVDYSDNADTYRVFRTKRAWVEGNKNNANDTPASGATWGRYDTTNNWSTAGGFHLDDCEQTDIGSRAFTATETLNEFKDFSLTPITKSDLDLGNGFMIKGDTNNDDGYLFSSSDAATPANRPKLTVEYTVPSTGHTITTLGAG